MKVGKIMFLIHVGLIIVILCSKSAGNEDESCKNIAALKGLMLMVDTISSSLSEIMSSAKFRTSFLEERVCLNYIARNVSIISETESIDNCISAEQDCKALYDLGFKKNGPYRIWPAFLNHSIIVYCDMETDDGGWTVIQRRGDFGVPHVDFFRSWKDYKNGFGDVKQEFWLGNDYLFALTNSARSTIRIDLETFEGERGYAKYTKFLVRSELEEYKMTLGNYEGDIGDSFKAHNDAVFSTKDRGNDCPREFKGGFWYKACHEVNLNGLYHLGNHSSFADGINWKAYKGYHYSMAKSEMKIRRCGC